MNQTKPYPYGEPPSLVKTIAVLTLINGIVNIFWGLIATGTVTASVILICLAPLAILPTILGIFEIIYALKLLGNPPQPVQPSTTIAILEILTVLTGNVFSMVVGILALVFYSDAQVKEYFSRLNGIPYPVAPAAPVPPAPPVAPAPDPIVEPESAVETTPEVPDESEEPHQRKGADETPDTETDLNPDQQV
jgi:hypothetical protein